MKKNLLALAFLAALSTNALAHGDRPSRYIAHEIPAVEFADPACLPGYATTQSASDMNIRRFAAGGAGCYQQQGLGSDGQPFYQRVTKPFAWSPLTGSYLLPRNNDFDAIPLGVDIYNNAYGFADRSQFRRGEVDARRRTVGGDRCRSVVRLRHFAGHRRQCAR